MPLSSAHFTIIRDRLAVLCREVGTLLLAFAPLDYALQKGVEPATFIGFVLLGGVLFLISLVHDVRRAE